MPTDTPLEPRLTAGDVQILRAMPGHYEHDREGLPETDVIAGVRYFMDSEVQATIAGLMHFNYVWRGCNGRFRRTRKGDEYLDGLDAPVARQEGLL